MSKIACRVCSSFSPLAFRATVLNKYEVSYYECEMCGYLFSEEPHWLSEAYSEAIASSDTGILRRNRATARFLATFLGASPLRRKVFLDLAGGYGILVREMRDLGFDFRWNDPHASNLFARGFEGDLSAKFAAITAFEALEHVVNPLDFVRSVLNLSSSRTLICSTTLHSRVPPQDWWYYAFHSGQHIGFFKKRTLQWIAESTGTTIVSFRHFHIFSRKPVNKGLLFLSALPSNVVTSHLARLGMPSLTQSDSELLTTLQEREK